MEREKEKSPIDIPEWLQRHRSEIDLLDRDIVTLLSQRHAVIRAVGEQKAACGMPAILPDRVNEVIENAVLHAAKLGLDTDLVRRLYTDIVRTSCDLEEEIIKQKGEDHA